MLGGGIDVRRVRGGREGGRERESKWREKLPNGVCAHKKGRGNP